MNHYLVKEGCVVKDREGNVLGEGGAVFSLPTAAEDKTERHEAEGILRGQWSWITQVSKPAPKKKKKTAKKAGTYKTTESTPEA